MSPFTIFYADDDPDDIEYFTDAVHDLLGEVDLHTHMQAEKLISALQNPPPSPEILFLDLNMPGKNGFQILTELRNTTRFKTLPIVILSTSTDRATIEKTRELGANYYVPKPNSYSSLKQSIQTALNIDWQNFSPNRDNFLHIN